VKRSLSVALATSCFLLALEPAEAARFRVDELGYHPYGSKLAVIEEVPEGAFQTKGVRVVLVSTEKKDLKMLQKERVMFEPKVLGVYPGQDGQQVGPGMSRVVVDFSEFNTPGKYFLRLEGLPGTDKTNQPVSGSVKVDEFIFWDTLKPVTKVFYLQRCGQFVSDTSAGITHQACHTRDGKLLSDASEEQTALSDKEDVTGGWHDASDYAKQTTPTSLATARLMSMYEWNPKPFQHFKLDYPATESFVGELPDLLHEIEIGLDWLLVMQRSDGAFYRKVSGKQLPGIVRPENDTQERFIHAPTAQDTAAATASLAMAARVLKKKDISFAIKSLRAAERGWSYLAANPPMANRIKKEALPSGLSPSLRPSKDYIVSQSASNDLPYRVWAAAELYLSTKKPIYHQYFIQNVQKVGVTPFSWRNPAMLGMMDYVLYGGHTNDARTDAWIRETLQAQADDVLARMAQAPYRIGLTQFGAGSNQDIVESAALLLTVYQWTAEDKYRDGASASIHFLFGMNSLGKSFVTGIGTNPVSKPAHPLSLATKKVVPGLLVAGPNPAAEDGQTPTGQGPLSYADSPQAFGSNEPSIVYNASLAFLLASLNAVYNLPNSGS
jgi:endoglucanase